MENQELKDINELLIEDFDVWKLIYGMEIMVQKSLMVIV